MRILIVGHGRMGRLVASLAGEAGATVAGIIDSRTASTLQGTDSPWGHVDVAVDFSAPDAVAANVPALARRGINLVVGTTGWGASEPALRSAIAETGVGIVVASNFSTGVVLFESIVAHAARIFEGQPEFGAWLHEAHHAAKKDAPSGTALTLERAMKRAGYSRSVDVSATRAGHIPGTHTIGFDGPVESITLQHSARDRSAFARGALTAAQWINGKRGWFTMQDVLGLKER